MWAISVKFKILFLQKDPLVWSYYVIKCYLTCAPRKPPKKGTNEEWRDRGKKSIFFRWFFFSFGNEWYFQKRGVNEERGRFGRCRKHWGLCELIAIAWDFVFRSSCKMFFFYLKILEVIIRFLKQYYQSKEAQLFVFHSIFLFCSKPDFFVNLGYWQGVLNQ